MQRAWECAGHGVSRVFLVVRSGLCLWRNISTSFSLLDNVVFPMKPFCKPSFRPGYRYLMCNSLSQAYRVDLQSRVQPYTTGVGEL